MKYIFKFLFLLFWVVFYPLPFIFIMICNTALFLWYLNTNSFLKFAACRFSYTLSYEIIDGKEKEVFYRNPYHLLINKKTTRVRKIFKGSEGV